MIINDTINRFHKLIIATICLMAFSFGLSGCGHKTTPIYIPDKVQKKVQTEQIQIEQIHKQDTEK